MPLVYVAVFIEHATPFMEEFLQRLSTLKYPTTRIRLFIHNNVRRTLTCSGWDRQGKSHGGGGQNKLCSSTLTADCMSTKTDCREPSVCANV